MKTKIDKALRIGRQRGGFGIQILYPGIIRPGSDDTGFATIGRIDQAKITPGTLVPMHPHRDDEILTYLRSGKVKHLDSEGISEIISSERLMMMNAGAHFYHEELVLEEGGVLEGLQIFIRPEEGGLQPRVQFHSLEERYHINEWRKIAGKGKGFPLEIRSSTWLWDMRLEKGKQTTLPESPANDIAFLLYVFAGRVQADTHTALQSGDSMLIEQESPAFQALETSDMVLFMTQTTAAHFDDGMYSGNQKQLLT